MARGGGNKKRFHHCTDPSGQEILYLRALQGHSGRNLTDPSLREESVNSERFLRVQLPHRMCNQITLHHEFRIDIRRTKFDPEIYSKKNQRERGDISQTRRIYFSNRRWTNQTSRRRSGPENIHLDTGTPNSRRRSRRESEGSLPPPQDSYLDACEVINDFWSMSGNFKNRHHVEPRVKLYSPREESFPIPLKYIDVTRTTHTNLDVKQEKPHR